MGRKLDLLLGRTSRQMSKLNALLGLTVSRLAVLRHQRQVRCANARSDVAQFLRLAHHDRALLRAEQVIKEQNMLDAFVIVEGYCHLITERAALLEHLKECPEEMREAISGLIYAASRCGDLPELQKVRYMFSSKFGKEFTSAAVELRNNCGVNPKLIQKLSTRQPSLESKVRVTKEIAAENGIALDLEDSPSEFPAEVRIDPKLTQTKMQSNPNPEAELSDVGPKDGFPANTGKEYKDVASAAQAAFESAAYAAAAARAAVELSRSESKGDDQPGSGRRTQHQVRYYSSESDEELQIPIQSREILAAQLEKCSSISSSASIETFLFDKEPFPAVVSNSAKQNGRRFRFDESENETEQQLADEGLPIKHESSYLHPPYRKGNPVRNSLHEERKDETGLGTRNGDHVSYYTDSIAKRGPGLRNPVSMRTRRGRQL